MQAETEHFKSREANEKQCHRYTLKTAEKIKRKIDMATGARIRNLRIVILQATVYLDGICTTFYPKQIAQATVLTLVRKFRVVNRIKVETAPSDSENDPGRSGE